jgi:hypothetical protein
VTGSYGKTLPTPKLCLLPCVTNILEKWLTHLFIDFDGWQHLNARRPFIVRQIPEELTLFSTHPLKSGCVSPIMKRCKTGRQPPSRAGRENGGSPDKNDPPAARTPRQIKAPSRGDSRKELW